MFFGAHIVKPSAIEKKPEVSAVNNGENSKPLTGAMEDTVEPSWMNHTFLTRVLQPMEDQKAEVEVLRWKCRPLVPPGSTYLSNLYGISVHYKTAPGGSPQKKNFIVKTPLEGGVGKEFAEAVDAYGREVRMYRKVLPRMRELHGWRGTAKSFFCPLDNCLVLEDLRGQGYKMANRLKQLDLAHCSHFLRSLSCFHALSVAVHHSHPQLIETVGHQPFFTEDSPDRANEENVLKTFLNSMMHTVKTLKESERYVDMISEKVDTLYGRLVEIFKPTDGFNVLNHGDTWTNNIFFRYNDFGVLVDSKMIDFQVCKFGSFAHDIIYFWFTSVNEEVREHHREEMFELYRKNLNLTLEELGCLERLTKEEFDRQIKFYAPFALQIIAHLLSVIMSDPDDLFDFSKMHFDDWSTSLDDDSYGLIPNRSKHYRNVLPMVLKHVEELGAFL